MNQVKKDIAVALRTLNDINYIFPSTYSKAFLNTNEQISTYYKKFSISGEKVLTVAASGDHLLQAVHEGAKKVDVFDHNRFALYVVKLKVAAIKVLSHDEFENFFSLNNGAFDFMSLRIYEKFSDYLADDAQLFWDSLYQDGNLKNIHRIVFGPQRHDLGIDSYRDSANYYSIREKIDDVSIGYYLSDLFDLGGVLTDSYKAIFLSNIYDWLTFVEKNEFKDYVLHVLSKNLETGGKMAVYVPTLSDVVQYEDYTEDTYLDKQKVYIKSKL